ncbi:hypothetical protein KCTCHS21_32520 [Cohnella abietis]|uniref:Uncharacterized protein n=1 Tax=Cohnella abietis TaxID=2507935 RepID=A0A3T1D704_9BACL|nr:hypothetical protein KCTCHS21_32520 [Cohnella abietis]
MIATTIITVEHITKIFLDDLRMIPPIQFLPFIFIVAGMVTLIIIYVDIDFDSN